MTEHWLAVEVISPSSRVYDREFKRAAYFALGVRREWLVDVDDLSVEVRTGPDAQVVRDEIRWRTPGEGVVVTVALAELFAGLT